MKIEILSDISGNILGSASLDIKGENSNSPPAGCSLLPGEHERADVVTVDATVSGFSIQEIYQRCKFDWSKANLEIK